MSPKSTFSEQSQTPLTTQKDIQIEAQKKIMDLLAIRDHSEKEVREKLALKYSEDICEKAMAWALKQSWFTSSDLLHNKIVENLNRKKKGQFAINKKLEDLGLEKVHIDPEIELEKALLSVETKFEKDMFEGLDYKSTQKETARVLRFLISRGFDSDIAQKTLNQYFTRKGNFEYDEEF